MSVGVAGAAANAKVGMCAFDFDDAMLNVLYKKFHFCNKSLSSIMQKYVPSHQGNLKIKNK